MNNISDEELLFELFAHRIQFMDYSINENFIIRKLKLKLIEMGYSIQDLNNIIYSFYNHFNILITMSEIENVSIDNQTINIAPGFLQQLFISVINQPNIDTNYNNIDQYQENNNEYDDMPPLVEVDINQNNFNPLDNQFNNNFNIGNLLNIILGAPPTNNFIFDQVLIQPPQNNRTFMEDIVVTTDENTLNTLNVLKITKDINENIKCMICIEEMNEDEEYFDIQCKHIFHKGCLETYLKNYNHICPVCRNEIGESNPHLN
jgi:hypothetical protein